MSNSLRNSIRAMIAGMLTLAVLGTTSSTAGAIEPLDNPVPWIGIEPLDNPILWL